MSNRRSKTAFIEAHYNEIEVMREAGVSVSTIVSYLNRAGADIKATSFCTILCNIRRKMGASPAKTRSRVLARIASANVSDECNLVTGFFYRMKTIAQKQGLSIEDVLLGADVNQDTYYKWQARHLLPRIDQAVRIAVALGVSIEELLQDSPGATTSSFVYQTTRKEVGRLCKLLDSMTEKELSLIESFIQAVRKLV